jgi:hypothetical protein
VADKVNLVSPQGNVVAIDAAAVPSLEAQGWRVEGAGAEAQRVTGEVLEEQYGGTGGALLAGAEGVLRGATFGLSDIALADRATMLREQVNPGAALGGELLGAVAPSLLSGGTGAVGTVARLTPAGLTAARGAQFVARGGTLLGRGARAVLVGAGEGAIQGAGSYVGRQALRNEAISADALAAEALRGGALGGVLGGGFQVLGEGVTAGARRLQALAGDRADDVGRRVLGQADEAAPPLRYDEVLAGRIDDVEDARRGLLATIDDARARPLDQEIDDLLSSPVLRNTTAGDGGQLLGRVEQQVKRAAAEFDQARNAASSWATRYQAALDAAPGEDVAAKALALPPELGDEGAVQLALLDEARGKLDDVLATTRQRYLGVAPPAPPTPAPAPQPGLLARASRAAQTVGGALETAQDLGLPVPTVSGLFGGGPVGEAVGWFLKLKAGARALKRAGVLPSTPATRAAQKVTSTRVRLQDVLAGRGPAPRLRPAVIAAPTSDAVRALMRTAKKVTAMAARPDATLELDAEMAAVDDEVGPAVSQAAARGLQYLTSTAPKNPLEGTPFADRWQPSPSAASDWQRRVNVVTDPVAAVSRIMADPASLLEVEALAEVYPRIWTEVQQHLAINADQLATTLTVPQREFLGHAFGVPLTIDQIPGYGSTRPAAPAQQPAPRFDYAPGPSQSPVATLEQAAVARGRGRT